MFIFVWAVCFYSLLLGGTDKKRELIPISNAYKTQQHSYESHSLLQYTQWLILDQVNDAIFFFTGI